MKKLGDYINEAREKKKLTMIQLGELAGVSDSYINQIEKNRKVPSEEALLNISNALGCSEKERKRLVEMAALAKTPTTIQKTLEDARSKLNYLEDEKEIEKFINLKIGEKFSDVSVFIIQHRNLFSKIDKNFPGEIKPLDYYNQIEKNINKQKLLQQFIDLSNKLLTEIFSSAEKNKYQNMKNFTVILLNILLAKHRDFMEFQKHGKVESNAEIVPEEAFTRGIPLFSHVEAGANGSWELPEPVGTIDIPYIKNGHEVIGIYVKGDSMEPRIFEDDIVVVRQNVMPENKKVGVFIYNNQSMVKIYTRNESTGEVILSSYNHDHLPFAVKEYDEFCIIGKVIRVVQNLE